MGKGRRSKISILYYCTSHDAAQLAMARGMCSIMCYIAHE